MKKTIIVLVILIIVAGLIIVPQMLRGKNTAAATQVTSSPVFTVRTENAELRNLQAYIEVNANVISGNQVAVMPDANGRLVSMRVGVGDRVQRGALIAEIDPSRPGTDYNASPVYAPISGIVVSNPVTIGSTVTTATTLLILAINGSIELEALIPEREIGQLRTGLEAEIRLEAFPGETFAATLTLVAPVVDMVSRTKKITLRFNRYDHRVSPGMFARVKLNTRSYENVVSVPQEAVVEHRGKNLVYVLDVNPQDNYADGIPHGTPRVEAREVSIGVNIDREVEIKTGLKPGEAVVVQGQQFLTDGAPVRVIGSRI